MQPPFSSVDAPAPLPYADEQIFLDGMLRPEDAHAECRNELLERLRSGGRSEPLPEGLLVAWARGERNPAMAARILQKLHFRDDEHALLAHLPEETFQEPFWKVLLTRLARAGQRPLWTPLVERPLSAETRERLWLALQAHLQRRQSSDDVKCGRELAHLAIALASPEAEAAAPEEEEEAATRTLLCLYQTATELPRKTRGMSSRELSPFQMGLALGLLTLDSLTPQQVERLWGTQAARHMVSSASLAVELPILVAGHPRTPKKLLREVASSYPRESVLTTLAGRAEVWTDQELRESLRASSFGSVQRRLALHAPSAALFREHMQDLLDLHPEQALSLLESAPERARHLSREELAPLLASPHQEIRLQALVLLPRLLPLLAPAPPEPLGEREKDAPTSPARGQA